MLVWAKPCKGSNREWATCQWRPATPRQWTEAGRIPMITETLAARIVGDSPGRRAEAAMATFTGNWDETLPPAFRGGAAAIGNFDGVHRGHLALLTELRRQAAAVGGPAVAVTFDPHPLKILRPERFQPV